MAAWRWLVVGPRRGHHLVQLLTERCRPSAGGFRAEVSTEAIGGRGGGRGRAAAGARLGGVQVALGEVRDRLCKPAEVGWGDRGVWLQGATDHLTPHTFREGWRPCGGREGWGAGRGTT